MHITIQLPGRSLPTALALGAATGAVFLGVGGRTAMRIFALLTERAPGWSFGGTLTVASRASVTLTATDRGTQSITAAHRDTPTLTEVGG